MAFLLRDWLLVAAGAVLGALLRFATYTWIPTKGFPWATLVVNLVGSFAIGAVMLPSGAEPTTRLWFVVGLLGAFTTLSTYSFETVSLWTDGRYGFVAANIALNALGGPLMALVGWRARTLWV